MDEEQAVQKETKPSKKTRSSGLSFFLLGLGGAIVVVLIIFLVIGISGVKQVSETNLTLKVADMFNLPAAKINGLKVSYTDYMDDLRTLRKFYESEDIPQKLTEEQISDQVLTRLVANKLIAKLADEYNAEVSQEDIDGLKNDILARFGSEEAAEEEIQNRYGWTMEKYLKRVAEPLLLEQALRVAFENSAVEGEDKYKGEEEARARHILFMITEDSDEEEVKTKAQEILDRIKNGEDFAALAAEFGSDGTKDVGGDLGWFTRGMMVPEFEQAVFALEPGQLAEELVKTQFGYHIVKLDEKRHKRDFIAFMNDQFENAEIEILIDVHDPFAEAKAAAEAAAAGPEVPVEVEVVDEGGEEVTAEE